jgi:FkbM family methyltransferase
VSLRVALSKQIKRVPPLFDTVRRATRSLGSRTPIYDMLLNATERLPEVAFIQIGSNDGISVDPIREFIVASPKWHGALVEPVPQIFKELRKNYAYLRGRQLKFFNVAVSSEEGAMQFWKIQDAFLPEFPPFAYQVGSFSREHVLKHFAGHPDLEAKLESIQVRCLSYDQIRTQAGLSDVHVLHLDVEGHEDRILNSIDFTRSKPSIIIFEISHMSEATWRATGQMLQGHSYRLSDDGIDCIASLGEFN